jgi:hypothetical protein
MKQSAKKASSLKTRISRILENVIKMAKKKVKKRGIRIRKASSLKFLASVREGFEPSIFCGWNRWAAKSSSVQKEKSAKKNPREKVFFC